MGANNILEIREKPLFVQVMQQYIPEGATIQAAIMRSSPLWIRQPPLGYEEALVSAYAYVIQQSAKAELPQDTIDHTIALFKFIGGIDPPVKSQEQKDVLRSQAGKDTLTLQIAAMEKTEFKQNSWQKQLLQFYRSNVDRLIQGNVFQMPKYIVDDAHMGKRLANPTETRQLFERDLVSCCDILNTAAF